MLPVDENCERRRLAWAAMSDLFLDAGLDERSFRRIAADIVESGCDPAEAQFILWNELFPVIEVNLRSPAGEWTPFPVDWLQMKILALSDCERQFRPEQRGSAEIISEDWQRVAEFLPPEFRVVGQPKFTFGGYNGETK